MILNVFPSFSLVNQAFLHLQHTLAVVDGCSFTASSHLLRSLRKHKLLTNIFLGSIENDLYLLDIALSSGGSHFSSDEFSTAYSE